MHSIADIRKDYKLRSLNEEDTANDPFVQFDAWWAAAEDSKIEEVNAMTLATVDEAGKPSARIVLLKGVSPQGFEFYTNYESRKGKELLANPNAALVIFWKELERQVRIEGVAEKLSEEKSDAYFNSRPRGSRIGAWSSPQSEVIAQRKILEERVSSFEEKFSGSDITRPQFWGGYIVRPVAVEFWQGRSNRLHDRLSYRAEGEAWRKVRLAP